MPNRPSSFAGLLLPLWWLRLCGCLLVFFGGQVAAQLNLPLSHQAWSTEEGLPDASVHQVIQSRVGYLWIATENGAARFDGSTFQVFRHSTEPAFTSDDVSSVAEDSAGDLWFGTADGLVEDRGDAFRRFTVREGLPSAQVLSVAAAGDGSVLVLTAAGLTRVQGDIVRSVPTGLPEILSLMSEVDGSIRVFTMGNMVLRYAQGAFTPERRILPAGEPVLGEATGPNGAHWVQTAHQVAMTTSQVRRAWPATREQAQWRIAAFAVDEGGAAWIGTTHGLFHLSITPGSVPEPVEPLRGQAVLALTIDREGDLWIGTEASGLHVLRPRAFQSEGAAAGEAVTSVLGAQDGSIWFGTRESGVQHILGGGVTQPGSSARLTSFRVLSLAQGGHGDLWVGTPDGLNHVAANGQVQKTYTSADGLPDDFIRSLLVDSQGTVWAGTRRGLARLERGRITVLTRSAGLPSDSIGPLLESGPAPRGRLWIGSSGGLARLREGGGMEVTTPVPEGDTIITALGSDGAGGLWVGVHGKGLFRWLTGQFTPVAAPGLPSEITALHTDQQGFLWIRSPQAVYRVQASALKACVGGRSCSALVDEFGAADGMPSDALAAEGTPQITEVAGGDLWFSTRKGIAVTDPAHLPRRDKRPPVVVQRLTVDGVAEPVGEGDLRIGPGHNRYVFDYAALSFRLPSKVRYRYRLDGFDREWVDAGAARSAYYTGLPPGRYRFRVLAANENGLWTDPGAALILRVLPPVYRRWWFYVLVLLLVAALVFATLRLRDRAVQRRFALVLEERNRMAREIHDTLAQDFVSVTLQLDIASGHLRGQRYEQAALQLQSTRTLVKEGLQAARQSIWNLRANAGERSLPTRLSILAARYSFGDRPPKVSIGGAFRKLAPALEDEVLRIAGESLSNAERHAGASEVNVELRYAPDQLLLRVQDNGRGFSPEAGLHAEGHYGVRGMYERAAALGGELRMVSSPGQGTTVSLQVPLRAREVMNS